MTLITRKMLKVSAGNWGKPSKVEKRVKLKNIVFPEKIRARNKKKGHQPHKSYISPWRLCPFCKSELPVNIAKMKADADKAILNKFIADWMYEYRVKECSCKAYEVAKCPCCGLKTWFNPSNKTYKHQWIGCGFNGKRKNEKTHAS